MNHKYSYLSKNVILFSLSSFVPSILSFILIPIYTRCLTDAEYGISDLISTTVALLVPIFTLDIQDAVMRFALDEGCKKKDVFSVAVRFVMAGTALVAAGVYVLMKTNVVQLEKSYLIYVVIMFFTTAGCNSVSLFCRGIDKVQAIVEGSIINSVVTLSMNILFLVVFGWRLTGYLAANSLGAAVSLIYMFIRAGLYQYVTLHIPKGLVTRMAAYSLPLVFSVIAWWINNASDRYILTLISGVTVSGVYAIAYKIPNILSMFQNVFTQAWSISAIKEYDREDEDGFVSSMYAMMNFAMLALCSIIMIFNIPVAYILYSGSFFEAWHYVPSLLIAVVFNAMALFIGSIFTAVKDTKTLAVSTVVGAAVNTVFNFVLIPRWSAMGAAMATLIGYAATLIMRRIILYKYIRLKHSSGRELAGYVIIFIQMAVAGWGIKSIPLQFILFITILMLYRRELKNILKKAYLACKRL